MLLLSSNQSSSSLAPTCILVIIVCTVVVVVSEIDLPSVLSVWGFEVHHTTVYRKGGRRRGHVPMMTDGSFLGSSRSLPRTTTLAATAPPQASDSDDKDGSIDMTKTSSSTTTTTNRDGGTARYGRLEFWDDLYKDQSNFSWYAGWEDLRPFVEEFITVINVDEDGSCNDTPTASSTTSSTPVLNVLLPGVGNDAMLVDMLYDSNDDSGNGGGHDDRFQYNITALDYAPEAIERCREMLSTARRHQQEQQHNSSIRSGDDYDDVTLLVADARNLSGVFGCDDETSNSEFDLVLEKGTLDAIYLSGGNNKTLGSENVRLAVVELGRCIKPGGIFMSLAGVVPDQIHNVFSDDDSRRHGEWTCLVDKDELYISSDGFTSNNLDGTLMVWQKKNR